MIESCLTSLCDSTSVYNHDSVNSRLWLCLLDSYLNVRFRCTVCWNCLRLVPLIFICIWNLMRANCMACCVLIYLSILLEWRIHSLYCLMKIFCKSMINSWTVSLLSAPIVAVDRGGECELQAMPSVELPSYKFCSYSILGMFCNHRLQLQLQLHSYSRATVFSCSEGVMLWIWELMMWSWS